MKYQCLPARIAQLRKNKGMSKTALAAAAGVSASALSKIEAGHWNITITTLDTISRALGTTAARVLLSCAGGGR